MKLRTLALTALLVPALPVQAQTGMEAFNPFAMLAPIMTPLGAMLVPMTAPMSNSMNPYMANPMAMMPTIPNMAMPGMPALPNFAAPQGMIPFTGLQATPQSFGMAPAQMGNPFVMPQMANPYMANPFANMPFGYPNMPAQSGFPTLPNFPLMFPAAR
jgi:hypothetical protein